MSEATFLPCESSGEPRGFARIFTGCASVSLDWLYTPRLILSEEEQAEQEAERARRRAEVRYLRKCRKKAERILLGLPSEEEDWESELESWDDSCPYDALWLAEFWWEEKRRAKQAKEKQELEKLLAERPKEAEKQPVIHIEENRQFYIELIERTSSQPHTLSSEHEDNQETKLRLSKWDSHVIYAGVLELCLPSRKVPADEEGAEQALVAC